MKNKSMTHPRIAVSTWSVNNVLKKMSLLDLPAALRAHGYSRCEICHFHLASTDPVYLEEVRAAFASAGVIIQTLLIDDGDITNLATRTRDTAFINEWIGAATRLGAIYARAIAGKQKPTAEVLKLAVTGLTQLSHAAATQGVKLVTENWFDTTSTPEAVHHIMDNVPGLGLMADTGNWYGPTKYADLKSIFSRAVLSHAKVTFASGLKMDEQDFHHCITSAETAGYEGPYTLIFADEGDEWEGLDAERKFILNLIQPPQTKVQ